MLARTKSAIALGIVVALVALGSLAGAPTADACPIDADGSCLVIPHTSRGVTPTKPKKHQKTKAPIRHPH